MAKKLKNEGFIVDLFLLYKRDAMRDNSEFEVCGVLFNEQECVDYVELMNNNFDLRVNKCLKCADCEETCEHYKHWWDSYINEYTYQRVEVLDGVLESKISFIESFNKCGKEV